MHPKNQTKFSRSLNSDESKQTLLVHKTRITENKVVHYYRYGLLQLETDLLLCTVQKGIAVSILAFLLYYLKVGVNPSLKREMWLLMDLITKKTCAKMYKSIHFWNQKNQMNPMVAIDFCKIMRFSRNSSVTMVTIEFFLDSITKIWFY